jgi:hypothetical protein
MHTLYRVIIFQMNGYKIVDSVTIKILQIQQFTTG